MKFGRNLFQVNMDQLTELDFRFDVTFSRWQPWDHFTQKSAAWHLCSIIAPVSECADLSYDTEARWWLRSASWMFLDVQRTRLSTLSDRAFPVAASRLWNSVPLSSFSAVTLNHISSHFLIPHVWLFSHMYSVLATTRFGNSFPASTAHCLSNTVN